MYIIVIILFGNNLENLYNESHYKWSKRGFMSLLFYKQNFHLGFIFQKDYLQYNNSVKR